MQATVALSTAVLPVAVRVSSSRPAAKRSVVAVVVLGGGARRMISVGAAAGATPAAAAEVDYSSNVSVFPMEACELVGGEACEAPEMYPETKLSDQDSSSSASGASVAPEAEEREYLSYDDPKTVFPGEACDDLGGEFCEAPYQTGVSKD